MPELHGNTAGLKTSQVKALKSLYDRRVPQARFLTPELARRLTEVSRLAGRQVGLLVDRLGFVDKVVVGDAHRVFIPELGRARAGSGRFRGLRLIVSHLRGEGLTKDNLTDLTLLRLDAVIVVQALVDGLPGEVEYAHVLPPEDTQPGPDGEPAEMWRVETRPSVHHWDEDFLAFIQDLEDRFSHAERLQRVEGAERCILIGVALGQPQAARHSLEELERLAETAGLHVVDRALQIRRKPDNRYLVGKGKLQDLLLRAMHLGADVLVFDGELAPSQLRNIATETELSVLDRTQLILDIFAQRATTKEGKLQVELAQLRYRKPRLAIMPTAMSRLTGGIGGRGPGETKLEINRRRADERLDRLRTELKKLGKHRSMRRDRRKRVGLPLVSIVGYTNAGKSTLLNRMTNSAVDAEDKLFATLDPTSRRMRFPEEREVILTDTVGFIRELPKELVEAFRSTLEEVVEADLILHVVDASDEEIDTHIAAVEEVLERLGVAETPRLLVLNKIDQVDPATWPELKQRYGGVLASAVTGEGLESVLVAVERALFRERAARAAQPGLEA
ncbi:MAG: GTPase HflX [Alphaproteobacteria bacterium]|nr:GTPase HflX [Alphaproteobacteria bacterium]